LHSWYKDIATEQISANQMCGEGLKGGGENL